MNKPFINQIDLISDPNCPFCALGFLQLQKALHDMGEANTNLKWHPFLINPHLTAEGMDIRENLKAKYKMDDAAIEASFDRFKIEGAALGFEYNYPAGKRVYPSDRAHQLIAFAPEDRRSQTHMALMRRFFTQSENFYDLDILEDVANEIGLDGQAARQAIQSGTNAQKVANEISYWQQQGIEGVPSFIFNNKYYLSGAIGVDGFKNVIQQFRTLKN